MRFWPKKKWKRIVIIVVIVIVVVIGALLVYASSVVNTEVASNVNIANVSGSKTALVIYQPGVTSFPVDVARAFSDGLASSDWRVETTTASAEAPSNMSNYGLLVIVFPIYSFSAPAPITRYVDRIGNLQGMSTVIVGCGAGAAGDSINNLANKVKADNGTVNQTLTLYTIAPNQGNGSPTDIARQTGKNIHP